MKAKGEYCEENPGEFKINVCVMLKYREGKNSGAQLFQQCMRPISITTYTNTNTYFLMPAAYYTLPMTDYILHTT